MKTLEVKIYNQTLKVNLAEGAADFYENVAACLDGLMRQEEKKSDFLSDMRVAVRVAFTLAVENAKLKQSLDKSDEVIDRISNNLKSIDM